MRTLRTDKRLVRWCQILLGGRLRAVTVDVSELGFCAELGPVFVPGSEIHGEIQVRGQRFPFKGTVTWASPGSRALQRLSRIGVAFSHIPAGFAQSLYDTRQPASA